MREGLKLARKIATTNSFDKYRGYEIYPGENVQTDEELNEYIKNVSVIII